MVIRLAQEKDIPALTRLLHQVGKVHHDIRPDIFREQPCKYSEAELALLLRDESRPVFVAEEKNVAGYAFCIVEELSGDPVLRDQKTLYIDDICVDEERREHHVGTALYEYVREYAVQTGCDTITLNVWEGNDSARHFYESKGMRPRKTYMELKLK